MHAHSLLFSVVDASHRALTSGVSSLEGTAAEYLEQTLPSAIAAALLVALGGARSPVRSGRGPEELSNELLRSEN